MAEHRMYLPLAAVIALAVLGGYAVCRELVRWECFPCGAAGLFGGCTVAAAALALGIVTFHRNTDYQSEFSVWRHVLDHAPRNARACNNFGLALAGQGRLDDAIAQYRQSAELDTEARRCSPESRRLPSSCRAGLAEARKEYEKTIAIDPDSPVAHNNLVRLWRPRAIPLPRSGTI